MCRYDDMGQLVSKVVSRTWKPSVVYYLFTLSIFAFTPGINENWAFQINTDKFRGMLAWSCIIFIWFVIVVRSELRKAREELRDPFGD